MLRILLMTQLYFADGTYEFRNFSVLVPTEQQCHELAPQAIDIAIALHQLGHGKKQINQVGHSCTDAVQELDFWPIPSWVPVPISRPYHEVI